MDVVTAEVSEEDEVEALIYGLIAERDRYKLKLGRAEGVIEEVKAFAVSVEGRRPVRTAWVSERLREIVGWPEKQDLYDNSWRKKFYPEEEHEKTQ